MLNILSEVLRQKRAWTATVLGAALVATLVLFCHSTVWAASVFVKVKPLVPIDERSEAAALFAAKQTLQLKGCEIADEAEGADFTATLGVNTWSHHFFPWAGSFFDISNTDSAHSEVTATVSSAGGQKVYENFGRAVKRDSQIPQIVMIVLTGGFSLPFCALTPAEKFRAKATAAAVSKALLAFSPSESGPTIGGTARPAGEALVCHSEATWSDDKFPAFAYAEVVSAEGDTLWEAPLRPSSSKEGQPQRYHCGISVPDGGAWSGAKIIFRFEFADGTVWRKPGGPTL